MKDENKMIETKIGEILVTLDYMKRDIIEIKADIKEQKQSFATKHDLEETAKIHESFVTKDEFDPYKKGLIAVIMAVILTVVNSILEVIKIK
jgi:hypothetical protein